MLNNIDWSAKMGMNTCFSQFITPFAFFDRWYSHQFNNHMKPVPISVEEVKEFVKMMGHEVNKRGMIFQTAGHGLTCEPFGFSGLGWSKADWEIDDETREALAMVNGKREFWKGVPLNTNLCMSNPKVRKRVVDYCMDYLQKNPEIDTVHLWLADDGNQHCECENCKKMRPSDFYIILLNELDMELTAHKIDKRVIFLLYCDLLWAPEKERLYNPDRFIIKYTQIAEQLKKPSVERKNMVLCGNMVESGTASNHIYYIFTVEKRTGNSVIMLYQTVFLKAMPLVISEKAEY